jgi:four helix bundle protein
MQETEAPNICARSFNFSVNVVCLCQKLDARPGVGRTLGRQVLRSGTSVGANAEEAQAAQSRADFVAKFSISLKEARETNYWLRLLQASGQYTGSDLHLLTRESEELARIIGAIIVRNKNWQKQK